jgi:hypothetical protein
VIRDWGVAQWNSACLACKVLGSIPSTSGSGGGDGVIIYHKGSTFMNGLMPFKKGTREFVPFFFFFAFHLPSVRTHFCSLQRLQQKGPLLEPSPDSKAASCLIPNFLVVRTMRGIFLLFINYLLLKQHKCTEHKSSSRGTSSKATGPSEK